MSKTLVTGVALVAALAVMLPAPVGAQYTHDRLTMLTFSAPVQVPGVILDAGTYRFHITNPDTSVNVLQVMSKDGAIVYGQYNTVPTYRTKVTYDQPVVTFLEAPADTPPPVHELFYEGSNVGYELMYPHGPLTVPEKPQPPITYTETPVAAPAPPPPAPEVAPEPLPAAPVSEPAPVELPKTGTALPLLAGGGLTTLLIGLGVGLLRRA